MDAGILPISKRTTMRQSIWPNLLWLITPNDFVIASGKSIYLQEIVDYVFEKLNIDNDKFTSNNSHLIRKNDVKDSYGTSFKIRSILGWDYEKDFFVN